MGTTGTDIDQTIQRLRGSFVALEMDAELVGTLLKTSQSQHYAATIICDLSKLSQHWEGRVEISQFHGRVGSVALG